MEVERNCTMFKMIDVDWKKEWFPTIPKYTRMYWKSEENQRNFLKYIASQYGVEKPQDWNKISLTLIRGEGGQVNLFSMQVIL